MVKTGKPQLLIFDVNETLLDLSPLSTAVNQAIGDREAIDKWFNSLLHYSLVETVTGSDTDFTSIGKACLDMLGQVHGKKLSAEEIAFILGKMRHLPAHADVKEGLQILNNAGFILVALSNGNLETVQDQLKFAGINPYFDRVFSVQQVGKFKPHPATYTYVLDHMEIAPEKAMMVAAHAWDILGAQRVGMRAAFISRPGKVIYPAGPNPEYAGSSLVNIAQQMIRDLGVS